MTRRMKNGIALIAILALCFAVSGLGALSTMSSVDTWYATLAKPPFNPPDWVFGPVWTLLYAMMAVAAWRVWREPRTPPRNLGLVMFWIQLSLNLAWSILFFGMRSPVTALFCILMLLLAIIVTLRSFFRVDRVAGWLLVPYLAWVSFATVLNASIWYLN